MRTLVSILAASAFVTLALPAQTRTVDLVVAPGAPEIEPGLTQLAWLYGGSLPGQLIRMRADEVVDVRVRNRLPVSTIVHWHGQAVHQGMDGMPGMSRPAIAPGQEFVYRLQNMTPGTYWYHSHMGDAQADVGLAGVLIVDPVDAGQDPPSDVDQVVVIDEWTPYLGGPTPWFGVLMNGRSSVGQTPIMVQQGQKLRLRFVNTSAQTNFIVALDGHDMTVTHTDGHRVQPVRVQAIMIGIGERYDVIVDANNVGTWSLAASLTSRRDVTQVRAVIQYVGSTQPVPSPSFVPNNLRTGTLLSYSQLAAYHPVEPITPTPNRTLASALAMDGNGNHTINGEIWPNVTPMMLMAGERVQMNITTTASSYHPMHIHGHTFRLMGTAGGTTAPPLKDTVLIRPRGSAWSSASVQFVADNPGRWMYHCHDSWHMSTGMIAMLHYHGDADGDGLADGADLDPTLPYPVLTIGEQASAFRIGGSGTVDVQWPAGEAAHFFLGAAQLATPIALAPFGTLVLDLSSAVHVGTVLAGATATASWPYTIPNDVGLVDQYLCLQAGATTSLAGGLRLSTFQRMWITP